MNISSAYLCKKLRPSILGHVFTIHKPPYPYQLPKGWVWTTVGESLLLISGQDFPPEKYNNEVKGIPYIIGASNIEKEQLIINRWTDNPSVFSYLNDILVVCKGAGVGKLAINNIGDIHIARQIQAIRDVYKIMDIHFLKAVISSNIANVVSQANGLIPGLKRELLLNLSIPVPPIEEQHRIVTEIESLNLWISIIEESRQNLKVGIQQAKSKILDLAIHGKLVPQDPNDEPASVLLKRINPKAEVICDNPRYGKLPQGWCSCHINDFADSLLGKTLDRSKNTGEPKDYLCTQNVQWGKFDLTTLKQFLLEDDERERYAVKKGDLMVCEGGDVGRSAIWENDTKEIYYQNALHRIRCHNGISNYYIVAP